MDDSMDELMTVISNEPGLGLEDVCEALRHHGTSVTFAAGSRIFEEGDRGDCAYMIERGYVEVSSVARGAKEVLAVLGAGEVFGEMALLDGYERSATATALHETVVAPISRQQLEQTIEEASPLARLLVAAAVQRLRATQSRGEPAATGEGRSLQLRVDKHYENVRADAAGQVKLRLDLESAIANREFELAYQPIVGLTDGRTAGFEALLRWPRAGRPTVSPAEFIPLAEQTGLIVPLGLWVLERGLQALGSIARDAGSEAFVSVNVSPRQLDTEENVERLAAMIERATVDPGRLRLEITEQTLLADPRMATLGLARLKATGAHIAIDDFGTGYSSLNYLHRFPLDVLKLDRSFVQRIAEDSAGQRVAAAIIALSHDLDMDVVAEGIEEPAELSWLRAHGCRFGQGYLMAKPMSFEEAHGYLYRSFEW